MKNSRTVDHVGTPASSRVFKTPKSDAVQAGNAVLSHIAHLQRTIGNRAIQRMLSADTFQPKPLIQKRAVEEEELQKQAEEGAGPVQAKEAEAGPPLENRINSLRGGSAMPDTLRSYFEPRFGYDFAGVRLHTDTHAAETARMAQAKAFTVGSNIVFGNGYYSPGTPAGRQLLAHELTHVVQQNAGLARTPADAWLRCSPVPTAGLRAAPMISRWALDKTLPILCGDVDGKAAVGVLNSEKYQVYSYDSYTYKRQYYTDATKTVKQGAAEDQEVLGYHSRPKKEIALKASRTDQNAASTFVHEVTHARQHMKFEAAKAIDPLTKAPTTAEKEYEAHIKQEEFNIRNNITSKSATFRKLVSGAWVVDVDAIKKWVDQAYAIGPDKFYDDIDLKVEGKKGPLGPWVCA